MKQILQYLKRHQVTDTQAINRLFVSAFIVNNRLSVSNCAFLKKYMIAEDEDSSRHLDWILKRLQTNNIFIGLEEIIGLFEFVVSPADRIVNGAVYTPERVRKNILSRCLEKIDDKQLRTIRVADISCGCGGFLMDAAQALHRRTGKPYADIFRDNIYGIDIEDYAIERTKILLSLLALSEGEDEDFDFNLLQKDTLEYATGDWEERFDGFDIIVGNPPYVCSRNLSEETRNKLMLYEVCSSGHPDLYIPFFQIATEMLGDAGRLGLITMNTFLRSVNGRSLRNYFSRNRLGISIVDFRGFQIFESKNTYTCLFFLDKRHKVDSVRYTVDEDGKLAETVIFTEIRYDALDDVKGWTLNDFETTEKLETAGIQIKDYCASRHGLATLSNETYIFRPVEEDEFYYYYYLCANGRSFAIEKDICRDIVNPNKLNSVDDLESLKEKVLYPYHVVDGKAVVYTPEEMRRLFPKAMAYLRKNRELLSKRDKGETSAYPQWYAFGRTQSLILPRYKLFFPKFANRSLRCVICDAPELMLYNGLAFVSDDIRRLRILKTIIESELFWNYIQANGKPYASGYYSLSGVDIKHFGIPVFSHEEEGELLALDDKLEIERWLKFRYGVV